MYLVQAGLEQIWSILVVQVQLQVRSGSSTGLTRNHQSVCPVPHNTCLGIIKRHWPKNDHLCWGVNCLVTVSGSEIQT